MAGFKTPTTVGTTILLQYATAGVKVSPNAEGIMALATVDQSRQWEAYWNLQNTIAA